MQTKQDWLGLTANMQDGVDPLPVYQDDNGVQTFASDGPYLMADGKSLQAPTPAIDAGGQVWVNAAGDPIDAVPVTVVPGGTPPTPPVPGPLDYVENGTGLGSITVEYDLARPVAMMGVVFRHNGPITSMTATHGGEPLELVSMALDDVDNIGAAVFIGNGLKIEPANLVITPVGGGTIGPALVRIDDSFQIDDVAVGMFGNRNGASYVGANTQPVPVVFEPVTGQGWGVYALASSGAEKPSYAIGWNGAGASEVLFGAAASSGTLQPVPPFTTGIGWSQNGEWWEHEGASSYLYAEDLPDLMPNPFWYEIEVDVPDGARLYVNTINSSGGGYLNQTFVGPVSGVFRVYRHQTYSARGFRMQGLNGARFRNFQYCDNGETVYGAFGRTVNKVPNGSSLQFQIGTMGRYAGVIAEVHEAAPVTVPWDQSTAWDDGALWR